MPNSLTDQFEQLSHRHRRRQLVISSCWVVAASVVGFLLLVACDRLLAPESYGFRLLLSMCGLCGLGLAGCWWWRRVSESHVDPLTLAQQAERQHPALRNIAANALSFARQEPEDPRAGSLSLRRAVVLQANSLAESVDWHSFLPARPVRLARRAVAGVLLVLMLLGWWSPQLLSIGWQRLSRPLGTAHWPREQNLYFVDPPTQILAGASLQLTLADESGTLPPDASVSVRQWQNGKWREDSLALKSQGEVAEANIANVQQSLEYRAVGGDHHSMPWHKLTVVDPPQVESVRVVVQPPAYAKISDFLWQPGMKVLEGSHISVTTLLDQPVASAAWVHQDGKKIAASLDPSGQTAECRLEDLSLADAGDYHLEFVTTEKLAARTATSFSLEVSIDVPPMVRFIQPTEKQLLLTPAATLECELEARDDLSLANVELELRHDSKVQKKWSAPQSSLGHLQRASQTAFAVELAEFSLQPGTMLTLVGRAYDYRPQATETSEPVTIKVVTVQEITRQLQELENRLQARLQQALVSQRSLRQRTLDQISPDATQAELTRSLIHSILFGQRRVAGWLSDDRGSALHLADEILRAIQRNRLALSETRARILAARDAISALAASTLPTIDTSLSAAVWGAEQSQDQDATMLQRQLSTCLDAQAEVVEVLEELIRRVVAGTDVAELARQLQEIGDRQQQLAERSEQMLRDWLAQPQQQARASANEAGQQQKQLVRELSSIQRQMKSLAEELAQRQPQLSQKLQQACAACQQAEVPSTMHGAAEQLVQRRFSNASQLQRRASDEIRKLNDMLKRESASEAKSQSTVQASPVNKQAQPSNKPGKKPSETAESADGDLVEATSRERVAVLVERLWGHLPERQRQAILQPVGEDFLPEYAPEIEAYFRALAEPEDESR